MAIQELDYQLGGKNQNADAPSHEPVAALFPSATVPDADKPTVQLATVQVESNQQRAGTTAWKRDNRKF